MFHFCSLMAVLAPAHFAAEPFDQRIELSWTPPQDPSYIGCEVYRSTTSFPQSPEEGELIYRGTGIHLIGIESDRGLTNGATYFYSIFGLNHKNETSKPRHTSASPHSLPTPRNLISNGAFDLDLDGWNVIEPEGNYQVETLAEPINGFRHALKMRSSEITSSKLSQTIHNLKEKTLYTVTMYCFGSNSELAPTLSVYGPIQQEQEYFCCPRKQGYGPATYSYIDQATTGYWREIRYVFWTGDSEDPTRPFRGSVDIAVAVPKATDGVVMYTNISLHEGILPAPSTSLDPKHPLTAPSEQYTLPDVGKNLVQNPAFQGQDDWSIILGTNLESGVLQLNPTAGETASAVQEAPYFLTGPHEFTLTAKVDPGKMAYAYISDLESNFHETITIQNTEWKTYTLPLDQKWIRPVITLSAYKQQGDGWHAYFKHLSLQATGEEWLPLMPDNLAIQANMRTYDFTQGDFDPNELLILSQKNSLPENLSFTEEGLQIRAQGNEGEEQPRSGAIILTKDYFASGRYDVYAKIGPVYDANGEILPDVAPTGCCFAIWPFSEILYVNQEPQWYDQPDARRNTEIDIELPTDYPVDHKTCPVPISWANGRLNAWGGQRGGIDGNITMHTPLPRGINTADGRFHQYTIVWHSGFEQKDGTRIPGTIEWYIDTGTKLNPSALWGKWSGNSYGFDNIPYRSARFNVGAWFPTGPYGPKACAVEGWAGTANWASATFTIKKIIYTPFPSHHSTRDSYQPDSFPGLVWSPEKYPKSLQSSDS